MMRSSTIIGALAACAIAGALGAQTPAAAPSRAPDATFVRGDGSRLRLSEQLAQGPVVLLFMRGFTGDFACFYCGKQTRDYLSDYEKIRAAGAEVIMVLPGARDVPGYLRKVGESNEDNPEPGFKTPYPVVGDPDGSATRAFKIPYQPQPGGGFPVNHPATIVIAGDGRILFEHHGKNPGDRPSARQVLSVLKGARPEGPATSSEPAASRPSSVAWLEYEAGFDLAKKNGRPVILDICATWCGNCKVMDASTFPDESVRELLKSFVPVQVDVDARPDLAKQLGIGALPDVRLIAPDGRQLWRLVGLTSAKRLASALASALKGESQPATDSAPGSESRARSAATPETIARAVARGASWLQHAAATGKSDGQAFSTDEVALFALCAAGVDRSAKDFVTIRDRVIGRTPSKTYEVALKAAALLLLDARGHEKAIAECARSLIQAQLANGQWSYDTATDSRPTMGDNSNTAFALLGIVACWRAGATIPRSTMERADRWWRQSQNPDGGWGYRSDREKGSYASMTENGIASLAACRVLLGVKTDEDSAQKAAVAWLDSKFSPDVNAASSYQEGRLLYHLFAAERAATFAKIDRLETHDWFGEGAAALLATQREDGSWDDGAETPIPGTSFALLFLSRSSKDLLGSH